MSIVNLPTGPPFRAAIIKTDPLQIRFMSKADQAYNIRLVYVPNPTEITSASQSVDTPDEYTEGLYYKFVEKVALAMGEMQLVGIYRTLYDNYIDKTQFHASQKHKEVFRLNTDWFGRAGRY